MAPGAPVKLKFVNVADTAAAKNFTVVGPIAEYVFVILATVPLLRDTVRLPEPPWFIVSVVVKGISKVFAALLTMFTVPVPVTENPEAEVFPVNTAPVHT
jgi:hypothetical protein